MSAYVYDATSGVPLFALNADEPLPPASLAKIVTALVVLEQATLADPKTKLLVASFAKLGWSNALIIDGDAVEQNFARAAANIPHIDVLPSQGANVYDILRRDTLVLTKAAVEKLGERLK